MDEAWNKARAWLSAHLGAITVGGLGGAVVGGAVQLFPEETKELLRTAWRWAASRDSASIALGVLLGAIAGGAFAARSTKRRQAMKALRVTFEAGTLSFSGEDPKRLRAVLVVLLLGEPATWQRVTVRQISGLADIPEIGWSASIDKMDPETNPYAGAGVSIVRQLDVEDAKGRIAENGSKGLAKLLTLRLRKVTIETREIGILYREELMGSVRLPV